MWLSGRRKEVWRWIDRVRGGVACDIGPANACEVISRLGPFATPLYAIFFEASLFPRRAAWNEEKKASRK